MSRRLLAALTSVLIVSSAVGHSIAAPVRLEDRVRVAERSPYDGDCGVSGEDQIQKHSEAGAHLAVNPTDRSNVLMTWTQDRFQESPALGDVLAVSKDGGRSWKEVLVHGHSACHGSDHDRAGDPWLSFGPDGTAYFSSLLLSADDDTGGSEIAVSSSTTGGDTWHTEFVSVPEGAVWFAGLQDKPTVTADSTRSGYAYLTWVTFEAFIGIAGTSSYLSRTTDGGATWSQPQLLNFTPSSDGYDLGAIVLSASDDTLLHFVMRMRNFPSDSATGTLMQMRSTDSGDTWSAPEPIARHRARPVRDPATAVAIASGDMLMSPRVAPDGTVYVAWPVGRSSTDYEIQFVASRDNGLSWSDPRPVARIDGQAFDPTLAVGNDGSLGVTFYDFRRDVLEDEPWTVDLWFAHSHDRGATWKQRHLDGPFDMRSAPRSTRGILIGYYFGLAAMGRRGFGAAYVLGRPEAKAGRTDVFFRRLRLSR